MQVTFGGKKLNLYGEVVKVSDKAPDFKAVNNDLSSFDSKENQGKVVVYSVVPSIDTGVCSLQARTFNEEAEKLGDDVIVITVSCDLPFAQKRFCAQEGIKNSISISDYKDHDFGKKYGFLIEDLALLSRGVVIVDKNGKIAYTEYVKEVTNEVNFEAALDAVKALI
ncbi:thiol peroxidase [Peptoniphilus lacrimalis]|uniref:thiol peroxidase n=1 Tax=Peptoniphilus TaxID=162289 RepID=UPI0001DCA4D4|nr:MULTISPECIES: thiol peroxidase [Peptoniphilus]EFK39749.1 redoxin family protein [Peptoniphilus sp. oral taxon 836 str. F0141]MDK7721958.1 thiol peroxidase [Peptoniphilus lacrimalis]MDK7731560.1 thiol peroxidase [Peptoniphilus lacrimalis]MDK8281382.1 thiol peroxidase [Peptoniphilus lacrimalis]